VFPVPDAIVELVELFPEFHVIFVLMHLLAERVFTQPSDESGIDDCVTMASAPHTEENRRPNQNMRHAKTQVIKIRPERTKNIRPEEVLDSHHSRWIPHTRSRAEFECDIGSSADHVCFEFKFGVAPELEDVDDEVGGSFGEEEGLVVWAVADDSEGDACAAYDPACVGVVLAGGEDFFDDADEDWDGRTGEEGWLECLAVDCAKPGKRKQSLGRDNP